MKTRVDFLFFLKERRTTEFIRCMKFSSNGFFFFCGTYKVPLRDVRDVKPRGQVDDKRHADNITLTAYVGVK